MPRFLDRAYEADTAEGTRALYDEWSATYEAEVAENGYATPGRVAEALAGALPDRGAALLDIGCGTGLSGLALRAAGFTTIDGGDVSAEMLARAEAKGAYRSLRRIDPDAPLAGVAAGDYAAIVACGVIGAGAAPYSLFDACMGALASGGLFALSLNDHALADPASRAALDRWLPERAEPVFEEHGPHLPGIGLRSTVQILRRR